jgi:hypothetical protein
VLTLLKKSSSLFAFCTGIIILVTGCNPNNPTTTALDDFTFKQGDYAVYNYESLDSANAVGSRYRLSRTILRAGLTIGGQSDVVVAVDSLLYDFSGGITFTQVDSTYYRVAQNQIFRYFDAKHYDYLLGGLNHFSIQSFKNVEPKWIMIADLKDAVSNQNFPTTEFNGVIEVNIPPPFSVSGIRASAKVTGRNVGRNTVQVSSATYSVYRQTQNASITATVPMEGTVELTVQSEYDFGIPSQNAPRTILRTQINAIQVNPASRTGTLSRPGYRCTLISFRSGS